MQVDEEDFIELKELEESLWISGKRFDREYMENILSPDFFEFGRSGRIYRREDTLSAPNQDINIKLPLIDFKVHNISNNVFLVTYVSEVKYDKLLKSNRSSVWIKTSSGWRLRFHQGTPVNE